MINRARTDEAQPSRRQRVARIALVAAATAILSGCSAASDTDHLTAADSQGETVDIETVEIMVHVVDPAARAFWKGWGEVYTKDGWTDISPKDDAEWKRVEDGAATVLVATNLLRQPGYARAPADQWDRFAAELANIAIEGKLGAERQDKQAMYELGETLDEACDACHAVFAPNAP